MPTQIKISLSNTSSPDDTWGVDINSLDYGSLVSNRLQREDIVPSDIPRELDKLIYKDICFRAVFGIIWPEYNPVENTCALINTVLAAVGIDFQLDHKEVDISYMPYYNSLTSYAVESAVQCNISVSLIINSVNLHDSMHTSGCSLKGTSCRPKTTSDFAESLRI